MAEDIKKPEELNEEELDLVAAGAYTKEEWLKMTIPERQAAQLRSIKAMQKHEPCELQ